MKIPTQQDFIDYRGGHTRNKWRNLPAHWRCPTCNRTRFELLTWTKSRTGVGVPIGQYQWLAPLHEHHDHSPFQRFGNIVICADCNSAEGLAKEQFNLPKQFSFSPAEMRCFITGTPHNGVTINGDRVKEILEYLHLEH